MEHIDIQHDLAVNSHSWWSAILLYFVTVVAGQYGLDRIDEHYREWGPVNQIRLWLLVLLVPIVWKQASRITGKTKLSKQTILYVSTLCVLHGYLAITALWTPYAVEAGEVLSSATEVISVLMVAVLVFMVKWLFPVCTLEKTRAFLGLLFLNAGVYTVGSLAGQWDD